VDTSTLEWETGFNESNKDIDADELSVFAEPDINDLDLQLELATAEACFARTEVDLVPTRH
jgi:hypothetical protein